MKKKNVYILIFNQCSQSHIQNPYEGRQGNLPHQFEDTVR